MQKAQNLAHRVRQINDAFFRTGYLGRVRLVNVFSEKRSPEEKVCRILIYLTVFRLKYLLRMLSCNLGTGRALLHNAHPTRS